MMSRKILNLVPNKVQQDDFFFFFFGICSVQVNSLCTIFFFASVLMLLNEYGPKTSIKAVDTGNNRKSDSIHVLY